MASLAQAMTCCFAHGMGLIFVLMGANLDAHDFSSFDNRRKCYIVVVVLIEMIHLLPIPSKDMYRYLGAQFMTLRDSFLLYN